jgi:hypothetical protein
MKLTQILIILISLAYGHSAGAMKAPRIGKRWRIAESILYRTLLLAHYKACKEFTIKITKSYQARLSTLYAQALEQNQINYKATQTSELPIFCEIIKDQIINLKEDRLTEMHRFSDNRLCLEDIFPLANEFKKEKGFVFEPDFNTAELETMLRFHAMLYALTYSLHEINEWIHPTDQITQLKRDSNINQGTLHE